MLLNYLKLSLRLMARNPFFTILNTVSLSIAFAAFYMQWPYSQNELKSDQFHIDYEQIARRSWHNWWTDSNRNWYPERLLPGGEILGVERVVPCSTGRRWSL
jgi:hypothetical protein